MSKPLCVAIDARVLGHRGVGRYLSNLLRALAERKDEVRYLLYLGPKSMRELVPADPRFEAVTLAAGHPALAEQWAIPRAAAEAGADVLHFPDNSGPLRSSVPVVLSLLDTMWLRPLSQAVPHPTLRQRVQDAYRKFVCPRAAVTATRVITISKHAAECLRRDVGVPDAKLRLTVLGSDPAFAKRLPPAQAARRRKALGLTGPYVLCSGASDSRKNIDRLIQAFALARARDPRLKGAVLAVTSLRPGEAETTTYPATARAAGVEAQLRFMPYISDADMAALYQGALCFAFPSLWEGFGLPVLEAYSMGCPLLAADATALPETAGKGAVYADPLDVESLAKGLSAACAPQGRAVRQAAAKRQLARFTWAKAAATHAAVYREAAGASRGH